MFRLIILSALFLTISGSAFAYDILCASSAPLGSETGFITALIAEADMDTVDY